MNEAVYLKSRNAGASKENLWVTSLNGLLRFFQFVSFISSSVMVTIHNHRFPRNSFALTELWTSATFQQAIVIVSVHCIPIEGSKDERVRHCWIEAPPPIEQEQRAEVVLNMHSMKSFYISSCEMPVGLQIENHGWILPSVPLLRVYNQSRASKGASSWTLCCCMYKKMLNI